MRQFKAAGERFAGDEANLIKFLNMKRRYRLCRPARRASIATVLGR